MAVPESQLISRDGLITRLARAMPRIVAAIAPAGYGKSTVMRAFASTFPSTSTCDCIAVVNAVDFAREILIALAHGDAERTAVLAQQQLAASADGTAWAEFAEQSWSAAGGPALLVFENVERILDSVENLELLARVLSRTPETRRVAICSRRPLPLSLTRFAAPHEILTLRAQDLRFDSDEIARALSGSDLDPESLRSIADLTRGWPIAVLLFARLARERSLSTIFEDAGSVRFDELYEYLAEQVLSTLPAAEFDLLLAVAAIPKATALDVAAATGDRLSAARLEEISRSSPLLYVVGDGTYEVHPLVGDLLRKRFVTECTAILRRTADAMRAGNHLRAAELYLHANDQNAAASMLEDATSLFLADAPPKFAELVSQLDEKLLLRYPAVWSSATSVRSTATPHNQWLHEALIARDHLNASSPLGVRIGVLSSLSNVLTNLGRHDEALEALHEIAAGQTDLPAPAQGVIDLLEAAVYARRGMFSRGLDSWARAQPIFADVKFTRALALEEIETRAARYGGDRTTERSVLELAVSLAKESGSALAVALTLEEAAFGSWFAGEDLLFERYVSELEASVSPTTRKATEVFRGCARGDIESLRASQNVEHPKIRCYAALIACSKAQSGLRVEAARLAVIAAKESGEPPLVAISGVVLAECSVDERDGALNEASDSAEQVEYDGLSRALDSYARGDAECGLLAPLVKRLRSKAPAKVREPEPEYCVFARSGRLYRRDRETGISGRELELLVFLASRNRACTSEEIIEALWPERSSDDSTVLRVSINRVRTKLQDRNVIVASGGSYQLGTHVTSDFAEMEQALRLARQSWPLTANGRANLQRCFERFCATPAREPDWPWFGPSGVRITGAAREIAMLLARDAFEAGEVVCARHFAVRIVEDDPCDEPARELIIRSYLAGGDATGALREFRAYQGALAAELGADPSAQLAALVAAL